MSKTSWEAQFIEAYEQWADGIFRHCYVRVSNRELAKDLMQETFMRSWQYLQKGQMIDNLKAFLYRAANNLIIDHYRKHKADSLDQLQEKGFDVIGERADHIELGVEYDRALLLLEKMEDDFRQVLSLRFVEDLSIKDIAQIVGESPNLVSVRIHRGLKKLKVLLEESK